jgi:hypothetical protein
MEKLIHDYPNNPPGAAICPAGIALPRTKKKHLVAKKINKLPLGKTL